MARNSNNSGRMIGDSAIARLGRTPKAYALPDIGALNAKAAADGIDLQDSPRDTWGLQPEDGIADAITSFEELVSDGLRSWHISPVLRPQLDVALGLSGISTRMLLSNSRIRHQAAISLIDYLLGQWRTQLYTWYFITLLDDRGNALEYDAHFDLAALRNRFQSVLAAIGLECLGFIEVQALMNVPQGRLGRSLSFHGHAVGWTTNPDFDGDVVAQQVQASSELRNFLRACTVVIRPLPDARQLLWRGHYLLKAPAIGKYAVRSTSTPSGWTFRNTIVRADMAVRLVETLSQLEFADVLLAAGDGIDLQQAWLGDLRAWHAHQLRAVSRLSDEGDVTALWESIRAARRRGILRSPIRFDVAGDDGPTAWELAAAAWLSGKSATRRSARTKR